MASRILVPIDGSSAAYAAASVALQVAAAKGSRLVGLHVLTKMPRSEASAANIGGRLGFEPAVVDDEIAATARARGASMLDALEDRARKAGVPCECRLVTGRPSTVILEESHEVDLVVLGLTGETEERFRGQGGEMLGWLPMKVSVPIVMVPSIVQRLTGWVVGYDGSPGSRHAVSLVRRVDEKLTLPIHAVHVCADGVDNGALADVREQLPDSQVSLHYRAGEETLPTLRKAAEDLEVNAIAVGYKGRHPIRDLVYGTTMERVRANETVAVLVAR